MLTADTARPQGHTIPSPLNSFMSTAHVVNTYHAELLEDLGRKRHKMWGCLSHLPRLCGGDELKDRPGILIYDWLPHQPLPE